MDFRTYLQVLEQAGDLIRINRPVTVEYEAGAICRQLSDADGPAVLMHKIEGCDWPLAANVFGTRRRIARALGTTESEMLEHVAKCLKSRIEPVPFRGSSPRCQEVVIEGDDVDVRKLPFPLWNVGDGGRYITAGMFIARHPEFGWNIAHHRGQIYGPREIGICMAPEHHLRFVADDGRARGERAEAAYVIGVRPSIEIAASSDFPLNDYEINIAGALEGRPIEMVKCRTVDVEVPEDSEIVIEGYFGGEIREEGPFVEYTGYQTPIVNSPVFTITAITHRRDPIVQGVFAGKPPCETDTLWRELEESDAFDTLRRRFPLLVALHRPPSLARDFLAVLQINPKRARPGIIKTLMLATSAVMLRLKYVICVDDDIDIYNISDVMYAVATRCDPKIDVTLIEGTMTSWLDPSSGGLSGKVLFDATKKEGFRGKLPYYPDDAMERARQLIAEGMAAKATPGPKE
jgi:UbiD family decarboxylase